MVGFASRRSAEDEILVSELNKCSGEKAAPLKQYVIVDARPLLNAQANQAVGKGYESSKMYENARILFMGIPNIHVVRKSYEMLLDDCTVYSNNDYSCWLKLLESSGWLGHLHKILSAVVRMVHCLTIEHMSVLVHCRYDTILMYWVRYYIDVLGTILY